MGDRINYYDFLRGIAIIGVVAIHSSGIGYTFNDTSLNFIGTTIWRQIINFSVPLFITLSGFFVAEKTVATKKDYLNFLKRQISRVLIPYCSWSILYISLDIYHGIPTKFILIKFITFQIAGPFYFILLIIQCYILLPFLKTMANRRGLLITGLISGFSCLIIFFIRYYTNCNLPLIIYAGCISTWVVFFVLGIYIRLNGVKLDNQKLNLIVILCLVSSIIETYIFYKKFHIIGDAVTAVKISSFCFSFVIILRFFNGIPNLLSKKLNPFIFIGEVSFGIFLSHMLILKFAGVVLNKIIFPFITNALIYQFLLVVFTITFSMLMIIILRKINRKLAITYFGC